VAWTQDDRLGMMASRPPTSVPADYRPLYTYLAERLADIVVLRFQEIEDLLGHPLPAAARLEAGWWATAAGSDAPSGQSLSWVQAHRSALANLRARTVVFERLAV